MHGPYPTPFPHFTEDGTPDLSLFLKNAVAEELMYYEAEPDDFRLYGFAVEYRTLAPKLLVVYTSDAPIDLLLEGARNAKDWSPAVSAIELTPHGTAEAFVDPSYPTWGPTSKLALMLALTQGASSEAERLACISEIEQIIAEMGTSEE